MKKETKKNKSIQPAPSGTLVPSEPKSATLDEVVQEALSEMERLEASDTKVYETHSGTYYQDSKQKGEKVMAKKGLIVAKKDNKINITLADPSAPPEAIMREKPYVPTQKVTGILAGGKGQPEVSKARRKKK